MLGLMQDQPLLISSLIEFAERHHGDAEIVSRRVEGDIHRYTWREIARALAPGRQRARRRATAVQRPRRHAGLERLPPPGAVLRRERLGPRAAHHQPAPASRPDRLDRQPRRRPGPVLRPDLPAAGAGGACQVPDRSGSAIALCDADKLPADSGMPNLRELRSLDRASSSTDYAWPTLRRELRLEHVLHERHHGQPEGRALQPPLDRAACLRRGAAGRDVPVGARLGAAGGADVPRQRLGHSVLGAR